MKKKIVFLQLTGGPLIKENKLIFTEGGLAHAISASMNLRDEYEIEILCPTPPGYNGRQDIFYQDGVKIICFGKSRWIKWAQYGNFNFFKEVYKYLKKTKPDILIGNNFLAAVLINFYPKRIKKIGILHHLYLTLKEKRSQPLVWMISLLEKLGFSFLKKLDGIGTINSLVRDILIKEGYPRNKIVIVGNGVDIFTFTFWRKKIPNSLIYIGRLAELKAVEDLVEIVFEIKKRIPKIILHICGDGPRFLNIKKKIEKFGLENNVIMQGYVDQQRRIELLQNCAIYVSASKFEGFDIPVIEAMATGCVPIVSDIYAHRFIFQNREVGFLTKNKAEMIEKIIKLLKEEKKRLTLARNGRKLVEEKWSWKKFGQRYRKLLQKI